MKCGKATLAAISREKKKKQGWRYVMTNDDLRGLSYQPMTRQRGFKGSKFGAAGPCRRIDPKTGEVIEVLKG